MGAMTEEVATVALVTVPWVVLALVAVLRGYSIHVVREPWRRQQNDRED